MISLDRATIYLQINKIYKQRVSTIPCIIIDTRSPFFLVYFLPESKTGLEIRIITKLLVPFSFLSFQ